MITVEVKVVGRPQWSVPLPPEFAGGADVLTLRELITRVVRAEVRAFGERQEQGRLLHALTATQIEQAAARGKIDMGGHDLDQKVDVEAAIGTALQGFEDGLYLVLIDGEEQRELEHEVFLRPDSRLTFLRLVMLAGG